LAGNQLARWLAVAVAGRNAVDQMFFIAASIQNTSAGSPGTPEQARLDPAPQGRLSGCFFSIITRQAIRRGSCTSVRQLTATIGAFIDHWNDYPRPFAWTRDAEGDPRQNLPRED
jgi:hypothetical protein